MSEESTHTAGVISDYFALEGHLMATRSADAYKAIDKTRGQSITLWVMRYALPAGSEAAVRFLARMEKLDALKPRISKLSAYGIDAEGIPFSVFPPFDGHAILQGNVEAVEAERRFIAAVRLTDRLHAAGITAGDLCGSSFWVDRVGDIGLVGVMGPIDKQAAAVAAPPVDTLPFVAPEKIKGGESDPADDVFALGVLGYCLFTGGFPFGYGAQLAGSSFDLSSVEPLSKFVNVPPLWAEQVIWKCLDPDRTARYANAGEVLRSIAEIRQRAFESEKAPVVRGERAGTLVTVPKAGTSVITHKSIRPPEVEQPVPEKAVKRPSPSLMAILAAVIVGGVFVNFFWESPLPPETVMETDIPPELQPPVKQGGGDESRAAQADKEVLAQIEQWTESDDPIAHYYLVRAAKEAVGDYVRQQAEKGLLRRARRFGGMRSVEQVRGWLRKSGRGESADYESILKVLDHSLPLDERQALLRQGYAGDPAFILRLTTALAFDSGELKDYQPILSQLIGDALDMKDSQQYSALGLILAHPQLATIFGEDIVQKREQLSDQDVVWVLHVLAERNDINTRAVANLALERGILSPLRCVFLQLVRDKAGLPGDVLSALIRAAGGSVSKEDISSFGRWYDVDAERILLAIMADTKDPSLLLEAFDILAGKSVTIEPSATLVNWVRVHYWQQRASFAHVIGVLGSLDAVSMQEVEESFSAFDSYVKKSDLIRILLETKRPVVDQLVLKRYGDLVELGDKLNLLKSSDKAVRMAAIRSIHTNHIGALKFIIDAYEDETDPDVRALYKEQFDIIRER